MHNEGVCIQWLCKMLLTWQNVTHLVNIVPALVSSTVSYCEEKGHVSQAPFVKALVGGGSHKAGPNSCKHHSCGQEKGLY